MSLEKISNSEILKASKNLADELKEEFNKLGYNLSYGYRFDKERNTVLFIDASYNSEFNIPYKKDSIKKLKEITPNSYNYNGHNIPVSFGEVIKIDYLLGNKFWIYLKNFFKIN